MRLPARVRHPPAAGGVLPPSRASRANVVSGPIPSAPARRHRDLVRLRNLQLIRQRVNARKRWWVLVCNPRPLTDHLWQAKAGSFSQAPQPARRLFLKSRREDSYRLTPEVRQAGTWAPGMAFSLTAVVQFAEPAAATSRDLIAPLDVHRQQITGLGRAAPAARCALEVPQASAILTRQTVAEKLTVLRPSASAALGTSPSSVPTARPRDDRTGGLMPVAALWRCATAARTLCRADAQRRIAPKHTFCGSRPRIPSSAPDVSRALSSLAPWTRPATDSARAPRIPGAAPHLGVLRTADAFCR